MTFVEVMNIVFVVLGLVGAIVGIFSILIRVIKKSIREEIKLMETDLINKIKGSI